MMPLCLSSVDHYVQDDVSSSSSMNDDSEKLGCGVGVEVPGEHDLLLGRGGETNSHSGNIKFRKLIDKYKPAYIEAARRDKPEIARMLVAQWKQLDPPGRFLEKRDCKEGETTRKLWYAIGDEAAKKRASKSLGEKQKGLALTKETVSSKEGKSDNPKKRLYDLEARAARNDRAETGRGSPRKERDSHDLGFPVAQRDSPSVARRSFLYQRSRREESKYKPMSHLSSVTAFDNRGTPVYDETMGCTHTLKSTESLPHPSPMPSSEGEGAQGNISNMQSSFGNNVAAALNPLWPSSADTMAFSSSQPKPTNLGPRPLTDPTIGYTVMGQDTFASNVALDSVCSKGEEALLVPSQVHPFLFRDGDVDQICNSMPTAAELTECLYDDEILWGQKSVSDKQKTPFIQSIVRGCQQAKRHPACYLE